MSRSARGSRCSDRAMHLPVGDVPLAQWVVEGVVLSKQPPVVMIFHDPPKAGEWVGSPCGPQGGQCVGAIGSCRGCNHRYCQYHGPRHSVTFVVPKTALDELQLVMGQETRRLVKSRRGDLVGGDVQMHPSYGEAPLTQWVVGGVVLCNQPPVVLLFHGPPSSGRVGGGCGWQGAKCVGAVGRCLGCKHRYCQYHQPLHLRPRVLPKTARDAFEQWMRRETYRLVESRGGNMRRLELRESLSWAIAEAMTHR